MASFQYSFWWGEGGYFAHQTLRQQITQQAEIEKEEIIFHKEVTLKLEELYKLGTDEAAIEAGKILTHEILHNTIDNTNILNTVE